MTSSESALSDLAERLVGTDASLSTSLRGILAAALQELIEAELTAAIGAAPGERTPDRVAQRNGHRPKLVSTPAGDVEVGIPKLRTGSFFPELLEPRRRVDRALWAVIMTAYITGTSTRKVDDLVKALGCDSGISKSTVSRICAGIDADVAVLRTRRLDHQPFVYVWLDATYVHVREHRHVVSKAVVIATGLRADGHREVLGLDVGDSENETFWREFLTALVDRGLAGVRLVISDAHAGLIKAIARCFQGASWQRCRVHAMRNLLAAAHHRQRAMIAALIRTVFAQPDGDTARSQLRAVVDQLTPYAPTVAERLQAMEADGVKPRTWAVESAGGMDYLLDQQLVAAGETVLNVPATLASRVRVLASGQSTKNDPNDARSVAIAALRAPSLVPVQRADHTTVCRLLVKHHTDLARWRNKLCCRLHALVAELVPGGISKEVVVNQARSLLDGLVSDDAVTFERRRQALELVTELDRLDGQLRDSRTRITSAVAASTTTLTEIFGIGPIVAAMLIGYSGNPTRFATAARFAAYTGTSPIEFSSGGRITHRLSRRGNRRLNHALHIAAITQIRYPHSPRMQLLRPQARRRPHPTRGDPGVERRLSDVVWRHLIADARRITG